MPQVKLSKRAQADILRLYKFLVDKDVDIAKRAVLTIKQAFTPLSHSPFIGREIEEFPELREFIINFGSSGYIALYDYEQAIDLVTVVAIKHQKEDDYK